MSASFIELQCVCDFSAAFCKLLSFSACVCRYGLCVCTFHRYPHHQHCVHANLQRRNEEQATYLSSSDPAGFCGWCDVGCGWHRLVCCQRHVVTTCQLSYNHLGEKISLFLFWLLSHWIVWHGNNSICLSSSLSIDMIIDEVTDYVVPQTYICKCDWS